MPLIDGIGDEVVQFGGAVLVLGVAAIAWWSTNTRPNRFRTVLALRTRHHSPVAVSIPTRSSIGSQSNMQPTGNVLININNSLHNDTDESTRESARVITLQEMDSIADADVAIMNNHRLHFYRRLVSQPGQLSGGESTSDESETAELEDAPSSAQMREMDSIVSAMEADGDRDPFSTTTDSNTSQVSAPSTTVDNNRIEVNQEESNVNIEDNHQSKAEDSSSLEGTSQEPIVKEDSAKKILIKLKYLNDTLKEVEGSLDELLKDFKWRHFSSELSSSCRVRLIFNGRVLGDECATLRACGLHHQAVVHCLVHPHRPTAQPRAVEESTEVGGDTAEVPQPDRSWDLESILMTLVSVALTVVWFFRCEYSNMFTASASVALFGLTVFYSVAIFGLYLSDTFHFERRPAQQVANN